VILRTKATRLVTTLAGLAVVLCLSLSLVVLPASAVAETPPQTSPIPTDTPGHYTAPTVTPVLSGTVTPTPTPIIVNQTPGQPSPATALPVPTPTQTAIPTARPTATIIPTPGPKLVTEPPPIRGTSAIVVDSDTGRILYTKDPHVSRAQASTTKLVTALTFLKFYPTLQALSATTTIVQADLVGEANMNLRVGEQIKLSTLLLGLLTNSANEAGMALARYAGQHMPGAGDPIAKFVAAMNSYAASIGMKDSHFMNPHGLDQDGHYSSAYDLALSGWFALRNPIIMQFVQIKATSAEGHDFYNVDSFLFRYPGATGLKPGWTDNAGRVLVATARNNGHNVLVVVMNSTIEISKDVDPLMDYGFTVLAGRTTTPLPSLNFGYLAVPGVTAPVFPTPTTAPSPTTAPTPTFVVAPTPVVTRMPLETLIPPITRFPQVRKITDVQALSAELHTQLIYTLQLAATMTVNKQR
jgi:D-alanyl-D-alanine carboxypeptidase